MTVVFITPICKFMLFQCHIQPSDRLVGHIGFFTIDPPPLMPSHVEIVLRKHLR